MHRTRPILTDIIFYAVAPSVILLFVFAFRIFGYIHLDIMHVYHPFVCKCKGDVYIVVYPYIYIYIYEFTCSLNEFTIQKVYIYTYYMLV